MSDDNTLDTTVEEWHAELQRIAPKDVPGRTLSELCEELKTPLTTMQRRITELLNEGSCRSLVGQRKDRKGRLYDVTVYQLIKNAPQKKAEVQ